MGFRLSPVASWGAPSSADLAVISRWLDVDGTVLLDTNRHDLGGGDVSGQMNVYSEHALIQLVNVLTKVPHVVLNMGIGSDPNSYFYLECPTMQVNNDDSFTFGLENWDATHRNVFLWNKNLTSGGAGSPPGSGGEVFCIDETTARTIWGPTTLPETYVALFEMKGRDAAAPVLRVRAAAAQTGDIEQWIDNAAAILSRINKAGYFMTRKTAAPADGDLNNSELAFWLDATPGATKAMFKAKDSGGTVRTGSVALA